MIEEIWVKFIVISGCFMKWLCIVDWDFVGCMDIFEFVDLLKLKSWLIKYMGYSWEWYCYLVKMCL